MSKRMVLQGVSTGSIEMDSSFYERRLRIIFDNAHDCYMDDDFIEALMRNPERVEIIVSDNFFPKLLGSHEIMQAWQKTPLFPNAKNDKIRAIHKIIQNGPATIIIDIYGNKTIVKYQKDREEPYQDDLLGFFMCLIKYLINDKNLYSDIVDSIFKFIDTPQNYVDYTSKIILSHIGKKDYTMVEDWFVYEFCPCTIVDQVNKKKKKGKKSCRKKYLNPTK